jgi:hypothetical protein
MASTFSRTSRHASRAAVPGTTDVRLPPVPAPSGAESVAVEHANLRDVDVELVGDDLRHGGLDALTVVRRAEDHVDLAGPAHADDGGVGGHPAEGHGGGLDQHGHPDADEAAFGAPLLLLLAQLVVADALGGLVEGGRHGHAVDGHARGHHRRQVGVGEDVAAAQLQRVDPELRREAVHHLLTGDGLVHPRAAVGAPAELVGVDGLAVAGEGGEPVGAGEHHRLEHGRARVRRGERPGVLAERGLGGEQRAVLVRGERDRRHLAARLLVGTEVLAPVLDPLDRAPEADRRSDRRRLLRARVHLQAEAATDVGHDHPDLVLVEPEHAGEERPRVVGALRGDVDREVLAVALPLGDDATRLHRHRRVPVLAEGLREHDRCAGDDLVDVRTRHGRGDRVQHVGLAAGVHEGRALGHRLLVVDDRLLGLDLDDDGVDGVLGAVAGVGDHHGDRLAHRPHVTVGEQPELPVLTHVDLVAGADVADHVVEVAGDVDRHDAGHLPSRRDVDRHQPAPCDVTPGKGAVEHPRDDDVVDELAVARQEPRILRAGNPLTHEAHPGRAHCVAPPVVPQPAAAAASM